MDAGNMLKPMLARGELRLVGATTLDEYRKHIEKDAALERRFQQVFVGEPSVEDTIAILRGLKERYEAHHKVTIADRALVAAASLSRPLHLRAAAAGQGDRPHRRGRLPAAHGDRLQPGRDRRAAPRRRPAQDGGVRPRARDRRRLPRAARAAARRTWPTAPRSWPRSTRGGSRRRPASTRVGDLKAQSTSCAAQAERAAARGDLAGGRRGALRRDPRRWRSSSPRPRRARPPRPRRGEEPMVKEEVGADDIAEVISAWTGIPAGRLLEGETEKLLHMEERPRRPADRPDRRRARGVGRRAPHPGGHRRPRPAHRLVPVPRPDRRRQDRAGQDASPTSSSTTSAPWSASTCASTASGTRWPG